MAKKQTSKLAEGTAVKGPKAKKPAVYLPETLCEASILAIIEHVTGVVCAGNAFDRLADAGETFKLEPYEKGRGADYTRDYLARIVEKYNERNAGE